MTFEERILSYLDGSLNDTESAELLHQLSVSPEKRVVLEQHLQLRSVTAQAQKSYPVPMAIEENLAMKLPIIAEYNRELAIGTGYVASEIARQSFFVRNLAPIRNAVADHPARIATGVLALASVVGYFFTDIGRSDDEVIATGSQAVLSSSQQVQQAQQSVVASPSLSLDNSSATSSVNGFDLHSKGQTYQYSSPKSHTVPFSKMEQNNFSLKNNQVENLAQRGDLTDQKTNGTDEIPTFAEIVRVDKFRDVNSDNIALRAVGEPLRGSSFGRRVDNTTAPWVLRLSFGMGQSYVKVKQADAGSTTRLEATPVLGVDYIASPYFSFGVEAGSAGISHILPQQILDRSSGISRVVTSNTIQSSSQYFGRGVVRFTPNPYDMIRLEASAGGGIAFDGSNTPIVTGSFLGNYSFNEKLGVSAGVVFSGAFTKNTNEFQAISTSDIPSDEPVGYVQQNTGASSLFVPSFTFRIGFQFKPW